MKEKNPLSTSELGTIWQIYVEKTMILRMLESFIEKADDHEARNIMAGLWQELHHYEKKIKGIFEEEQVAIPTGFTSQDVNLEAPKLFDNGFDILCVRFLKEISLGMYTMSIDMSYREDVMSIYQNLTSISQRTFKLCTHYLVDRGIITLPPNVSIPKTTEIIQNVSYLNGLNPFTPDRPLNDIEIGILFHRLEANNFEMQLLTGFAQVAEKKEIRTYFNKGKKIVQKQIKEIEQFLLENEVQLSSALGSSIVTTSTVAPFSDKLMMYCVFLNDGLDLVGNSFGTMFALRNDISLKHALTAKDIYFYANEGIKLMIKNQWFEEPPQMADRNKLINRGR